MWRRWTIVAAVALVGAACSTGAFLAVRGAQRRETANRLRGAASDRVSAVRQNLAAHLLVLRALRSFYRGSRRVERAEFHEFIAPLLTGHRDIEFVAWLPRVPAARREAAERAAAEEGLGGFRISVPAAWAAGATAPADEHFPMLYVHSSDGAPPERGVDWGACPEMRGLLAKACRTGETVAGGWAPPGPGVPAHARLALWTAVTRPDREEAAEAAPAPEGMLLMVFSVPATVEEALAALRPGGVDIWTYDVSGPGPAPCLHYHPSRTRKRGSGPPRPPTSLVQTAEFDFAGRRFRIVSAAAPALLDHDPGWVSWALLATGLVSTSLVSAYLVASGRSGVRLSAVNGALSREVDRRKQAEAQKQAILDSQGEHVILQDRQLRVIWPNLAACRSAGMRREELIGRHCYEIWQRRSTPCDDCPVTVAMATGESQERETATPDGRWWFVRGHPLRDRRGRIVGGIEVTREITERKRAEEELRRFRIAVDTSADAVGMSTPEGVHVYHNASFSELFGYATAEELAAAGGGRALYDDPAVGEEVFGTIMAGGQWEGEARMTTKDGKKLTVLLRAGAVKDGDGHLLAIIGIHTDLTQRKRAEEELRRAKEAAEAASCAKSEFLANMSHEIRTPMTAILGFADLLDESLNCCEECAEHRNCEVRRANSEHLRAIRSSGRHLLTIINDILDLSRIEAGKMAVNLEPSNLAGLIAEVASMMRPRADGKGVALVTEFPTELPETVLADRARLRQALVNLVGNAVKFTESGSVTVRTSFLPQWHQVGPAVRMEVVDTGIGIAPEVLSKLFRPFEQGDASTSRRYGGTGLGLAITRRIALLLGGELTAESTPGVGSTFRLTFPTGPLGGVATLADPAEAVNGCGESKATDAADSPDLAGLRVLLAEDAEYNQRLICTVLTKAGAEVETARNGSEALDALELAAVDVVLMDMQMPEVDGYQAARALRRRSYDGPILALTAHAMSGDREKCLAAGCDDHIAKPIDRKALVRKVAQWARGPDDSPGTTDDGDDRPARPTAPVASEYADDPDLAEVIDEFVAGLPDQLGDMRRAADAGCFEKLRRLAHQLKGAGGSYGYPGLTDAAKRLEDAARAGDEEACGLALGELDRRCRAVAAGRPTRPTPETQP